MFPQKLFAVVLLGLAAAGCAPSGPLRFHVSGKVTADGQPLSAGLIYFEPNPRQGNSGPQGFATVKNGQFSTKETGEPSVPGPVVVKIQAFDGQPRNELPMGKLLGEQEFQIELPKAPSSKDFEVSLSAPTKK